MPLAINDTAPDFEADSTEGRIRFHDWLDGKWAVLFSHPKDFTPVCTTELGTMARTKREFDKRGVKIISLSVDQVEHHKGWAADIKETQGFAPNFPMIGDHDLKVSKLFGMLPASAEGDASKRTAAVAAFLPDEYVTDAEEKIAVYKRLADLAEPEDVDAMRAEMTDRFGKLTPEARALFDLRHLKVLGRKVGALQIQVRGPRIEIDLAKAPDKEMLKGWMSRLTVPVEFAAGDRFGLKVKNGGADPVATAAMLLSQIAGTKASAAVGVAS